MIEGTLKDTSLPGLLQFLAMEPNKLYKVKLSSGNQAGEIYVSNGLVIHASFHLLEGEDALCEFLSWRDGSFQVERLASVFESTIKKNVTLRLQGPNTFVSQSAFLIESNVGLNTLIVPSRKFGGLEWQDAIRTQPLDREDFLVLGWIKEGRTLRQAAREFAFDLVKATGVLYRLLLTQSVEVMRTGASMEEQPTKSEPGPVAISYEEPKPAASEPKAQTEVPKIPEPQPKAQAEGTPTVVFHGPKPGMAMPAGGELIDSVGTSVGSALSALRSALEPKPYVKPDDGKVTEIAKAAENIDFAPNPVSPAPMQELPEENVFTGRTTDALPLVTIDIERLLQAKFTATQFGKLALSNQGLDQHLRQTLHDVDVGASLNQVLIDGSRSPASVLSTYRFCLARGYIVSSDPVIPLTADLLLGRIELDQYLLQRRRINGDELRDLIEIERQKGSKLADLLVKNGYLTVTDLHRLTAERKRFALK